MRLRNPLTKFQADASYEKKGYLRRDLDDNATEYLVIGNRLEDLSLKIEYELEMPLMPNVQQGTLYLTQNTLALELDHEYSYITIDHDFIQFNANFDGDNIRLQIQTSGIGENPIFRYKILRVSEV